MCSTRSGDASTGTESPCRTKARVWSTAVASCWRGGWLSDMKLDRMSHWTLLMPRTPGTRPSPRSRRKAVVLSRTISGAVAARRRGRLRSQLGRRRRTRRSTRRRARGPVPRVVVGGGPSPPEIGAAALTPPRSEAAGTPTWMIRRRRRRSSTRLGGAAGPWRRGNRCGSLHSSSSVSCFRRRRIRSPE